MSAAESLELDLAPRDVDSEENVIAAALQASDYGENLLVSELSMSLDSRMFFREKHGEIWGAISAVSLRGDPVTIPAVARELAQQNMLEGIGGQSRLLDFTRHGTGTVGALWYAEQVRTAWLRRCYVQGAHGLITTVSQGDGDPTEEADGWIQRLIAVGDVGRSDKVVEASEYYRDRADALIEFLHDPTAIRGVRTPWNTLDRALGGLRPTQVYTVMADTSIGKSLFAHQVAMHAALHGTPVTIATGEMSHAEVFDRMAFMRAGVDPQTGVKRRSFTDEEKRGVMDAMGELSEITLPVLNDLALPTVMSQVRRLVAAGKCELLIIDHIQHVTVPKVDSKVDAIEHAMREIKALALSEAIPVLIVSHINRNAHQFGMSNASSKNSSSIEQDSNVTMSLTPGRMVADTWTPFDNVEEMEDYQAKNNQIDVKLRLMKQRAGVKGNIILRQDWNRGGQYYEVTR